MVSLLLFPTMKRAILSLSFSFLTLSAYADAPCEYPNERFFLPRKEPGSFDPEELFNDLETAKKVDTELNANLPIIYNYNMTAGYFDMPSARSPRVGSIGFGLSWNSPYRNLNVHFQIFDRVELSANYHTMVGYEDPILGPGFGDVADRSANFKLVFLRPEDTDFVFPGIALGMEDFFGSENFHAKYAVITQVIRPIGLEATLGYGQNRINKFFGGIAFYPFWRSNNWLLKGIGILAEYDATNFAGGPSPFGRTHRSRINAGFYYILGDYVHLSISSLRGEKIAGSISLHTNLGKTEGFIPQFMNPRIYNSPENTEPIGALRPYGSLAHEFAYAFRGQNLNLLSVAILRDKNRRKILRLSINNPSYRKIDDLKERVIGILAKLTPDNIYQVTTVIDSSATPIFQWDFDQADLSRYRKRLIGPYEISLLAPAQAYTKPAAPETEIYKKNYSTFNLLLRPRIRSFFGNSSGKYKADASAVITAEGFLQNQIYYKITTSVKLFSRFGDVQNTDKLNPSQIINVRSDIISYFKNNTVTLDKAFLQKNFSMTNGWFARIAAGYFEIAYGGGAFEVLFQRPDLPWGIGVEGAILKKRKYKGLGFTNKIRKLNMWEPSYENYLGYQYFLNIYYDAKSLNCKAELKIGQFLARDKGARVQLTRYFNNGLMFYFWVGFTDAVDIVNGQRFFDKGIGISIPLDFFSTRANRERIGTAAAFWLRDTAAVASTGRPLYDLVHSQFLNH
jgi:hypothetical protein